jgi:hypothetical protein
MKITVGSLKKLIKETSHPKSKHASFADIRDASTTGMFTAMVKMLEKVYKSGLDDIIESYLQLNKVPVGGMPKNVIPGTPVPFNSNVLRLSNRKGCWVGVEIGSAWYNELPTDEYRRLVKRFRDELEKFKSDLDRVYENDSIESNYTPVKEEYGSSYLTIGVFLTKPMPHIPWSDPDP